MIRTVEPDDIGIFFDHQNDQVATDMAGFPVRDRPAHEAHWARILADSTVIARTIVGGDQVVGNIGSWVSGSEREVGFWIGREHWGRGHATAALNAYLAEVGERPVLARVVEHNRGSLRVLTRCGFVVVGEDHQPGDPVTELILRLDA